MSLAELLVEVLWRLRDEQDRRAELAAERDHYRLLAQAFGDALHDLTVEHDRHREQHRRLLDEYRHLREAVMERSAAA